MDIVFLEIDKDVVFSRIDECRPHLLYKLQKKGTTKKTKEKEEEEEGWSGWRLRIR